MNKDKIKFNQTWWLHQGTGSLNMTLMPVGSGRTPVICLSYDSVAGQSWRTCPEGQGSCCRLIRLGVQGLPQAGPKAPSGRAWVTVQVLPAWAWLQVRSVSNLQALTNLNQKLNALARGLGRAGGQRWLGSNTVTDQLEQRVTCDGDQITESLAGTLPPCLQSKQASVTSPCG